MQLLVPHQCDVRMCGVGEVKHVTDVGPACWRVLFLEPLYVHVLPMCVSQVMKVSSGEKLPTVLKKVKFSSIAWTHDNKGFFYQVKPNT